MNFAPFRNFFAGSILLAVWVVSPVESAGQGPGNYFVRPVPHDPAIAFIPVQFSNQSAPGFTIAAIAATAQDMTERLMENSYDQCLPVITVTNVVPIGPTTAYVATLDWDNVAEIWRDVKAVAPAVGVNLATYDYHVLFLTKTFTGAFNGLGQEGIPAVIVTNSSNEPGFVATTVPRDLALHELGHKLGLEHASFWRSNEEGNPISLNGVKAEYGDHFDPMGSRFQIEELIPDPLHVNPRSKTLLGWQPENEVFAPASPGTWSVVLRALEDPPPAVHIPNEYSAVKLPKAAGEEYWVLYRRGQPFVENGPLIISNLGGAGSLLYDMTPLTKPLNLDWQDAALAPGRSFLDGAARVRITNQSVAAGKVNLQVQYGGEVPPPVFDRLPVLNVISPAVGPEVTANLVNYVVTAYDPDVGSVNGAGIQSVQLQLFRFSDPDGSPPRKTALHYGSPSPNYNLEVNRSLLGLPTGTYVLVITATATNGAQSKLNFMHWLL